LTLQRSRWACHAPRAGIGRTTKRPSRREAVGFVAALDRLDLREISGRFLSEDERIQLAGLHRDGLSVRAIARRLSRAPSDDFARAAPEHPGEVLPPVRAHRRGTARRARHHRRRVDTHLELRPVIAELLAQRCGPQQTSRQLRQRFPHDPAVWLCHENIYQALYQPESPLMRPSPLAPQHRSPLLIGRDHRRAQQRTPTGGASGSNNQCACFISGRSTREPQPSGELGRRPDHRQRPAVSDRHAC